MCGRWDSLATQRHPEIHETDRLHYHPGSSTVYHDSKCDAAARTTQDQELIPVGTGSGILIRPEARLRALGRMAGVDSGSYRCDPTDEWFD
jgi:hypothetical protein